MWRLLINCVDMLKLASSDNNGVMDCPFCTEACTCAADSAVPDTESESSAYSVYEDDEPVDYSFLFSSDSSSEEEEDIKTHPFGLFQARTT